MSLEGHLSWLTQSLPLSAWPLGAAPGCGWKGAGGWQWGWQVSQAVARLPGLLSRPGVAAGPSSNRLLLLCSCCSKAVFSKSLDIAEAQPQFSKDDRYPPCPPRLQPQRPLPVSHTRAKEAGWASLGGSPRAGRPWTALLVLGPVWPVQRAGTATCPHGWPGRHGASCAHLRAPEELASGQRVSLGSGWPGQQSVASPAQAAGRPDRRWWTKLPALAL